MPASSIALADGTEILVEVADVGVVAPVGVDVAGLASLQELLRKLAAEVHDAIVAVAPDEATVKVGVKVAADSSGALRWIVGKLDAETTLEVDLTWKKGA